MTIWNNLTPELQTFLASAAADGAGGLAAGFADALLRYVGSRVRDHFRPPPRQQALERAAGTAIAAAVADWQLAHADYADLWQKFGTWLLNPAVLSEFRLLLTPSAAATFDVDLLRDEFSAAGLVSGQLAEADFDALLQDLVGGFYVAAAEEPELQEPLKIGLLRQMADSMGALTRLAQRQNRLGRQTVGQLTQLNVLAADVRDGIRTVNDLLQAVLVHLQSAQPDPLHQQAVYQLTANALTKAGYGDLVYAEVGDGAQTVAIGSAITQIVNHHDLSAVQALLQEIRDQLSRPASTISSAELRVMEASYRQSLVDQFEKLTFRGITPSGKALSLDLAQVYVELKAVADIPDHADTYSAAERRLLLEADARSTESRGEMVAQLDTLRLERWRGDARREREQASRLQRRSIGELIADPSQRGLVILGDPGSGKSTLLHYLALTYANPTLTLPRLGRELSSRPTNTDSLITDPLTTDPLPIFVPFAAYDDHLRRSGQSLPLGDFLAIYYEKWRNLPGLGPLFQEALHRGRALLLLDGLDEVLETATRQHVAEQAGALIQQWQGRGNRFVVTSRVVGYREARLPGDLPHVTVLDFGRSEIEQFARQWCRTYEIWAAGRETPTALQQAASEEKALLDDVHGNSSVEQLAANPLLLTMLAILRRQVGKLPDRRVELYERYVRTLIDNREQERSRGARQHAPARFDPHRALYHLTDLALWLQQHRPSGTARRVDLEAALVEICLGFDGHTDPATAPARAQVQASHEAEAFLNDMRHFAGLLAERGRDAFGFLHLTFQEYFAGRALARLTPEARWATIQPHLHKPRWREPILLCAGQLGVIEQRRELASDLAQRILDAGSEHEAVLHRDLFLAAALMADDVGLPPALCEQLHSRLTPLQARPIPTVQNMAISGLMHLARICYTPALSTLLTSLDDEKLTLPVLRNACILVGESNGKRLYQAITAKLNDSANDVRQAAVEALAGLVGSDAQVRQAVVAKLNDSDKYVRQAAVEALAGLVASDVQVCQAVIAKLNDSQWYTRRVSVRTLAGLVASHTQVRQVIIAKLNDSNKDVRQAAVEALAELVASDEYQRQAITAKLDDTDKDIRQAAVKALAGLVSSDEHLRQAIIAKLNDIHPNVRQAAVEALAGLVIDDTQVRQAIIAKLDDSRWYMQRAAMRALAGLVASDEHLRQTIIAKLNHSRWYMQRAAMRALAGLVASDEHLRQTIIAKLNHSRWYMRQVAVQMLAGLVSSDDYIRQIIIAKLEDTDKDVRQAAIQALAGVMGSDEHLRQIIIAKLDDNKWDMRQAVVQALAGLVDNDAQVRQAITTKLDNEVPRVRLAAVQALAGLVSKDTKVRQAITARLEDNNEDVREAAIEALAGLASNNEHQHQAITAKLEHSNEDIQQETIEILTEPVASDEHLHEAVISKLYSSQLDVRQAAIRASAGQVGSNEHLRQTIIAKLDKEYYLVRRTAMQVLAGLVASDVQVRQAIITKLDDSDKELQLAAVKALAGLVASDVQVRQAIMTKLDDSDKESQLAAVKALAGLVASDAQVRQAIMTKLDDSDKGMRQAVVQVLAERVASDAQVRQAIMTKLDDSDKSMRQAAVQILARLVANDAQVRQKLLPWLGMTIDPLLSQDEISRWEQARDCLLIAYGPLLTDETLLAQVVAMLDAVAGNTRHTAARLLIAMPNGPPQHLLPKLRSLFEDMRGEESSPVRLQVAALLINDRDQPLSQHAIQVTLAALDYATQSWYHLPQSGPAVRKQAATILGQLDPLYRDPAIFARLARVLEEDQDAEVRDAAYGALLRLAAAPEGPG